MVKLTVSTVKQIVSEPGSLMTGSVDYEFSFKLSSRSDSPLPSLPSESYAYYERQTDDKTDRKDENAILFSVGFVLLRMITYKKIYICQHRMKHVLEDYDFGDFFGGNNGREYLFA